MSESHPPGIGRRVYVSMYVSNAAADAAVASAASAAAASAAVAAAVAVAVPHGPARHSCQKSPSPNLSPIAFVRSTHTEAEETDTGRRRDTQTHAKLQRHKSCR